jgi:hypothetical protein
MSRHILARAPDPHAAPPVAIATRRDLFGTMGAMLLLTAVEAGPAKAAELDGELIELSAEFVAWKRADHGAYAAMDEAQRQAACLARPRPWSEAAHHTPDRLLVTRIARMPARTPEGLRAKATALWWFYDGTDEWEPFGWRREDALLASVLDDVLGRAGA